MNISDFIFPIACLGGLGLIFGVVLGFASKKFAVPVDEKVPLIREVLPGVNCGACGYAGCDAYAQAITNGAAAMNACPVGGEKTAAGIGRIMGVEVHAAAAKKAFVKCVGTCDVAKRSGVYYGNLDCKDAAVLMGGGPKACRYGCMGFGTCISVCQYDAIQQKDGVVFIDEDKCTACGMCVSICPKGVIELRPVADKVRVYCNSKDKLKDTKEVCSIGCLGCGVCAKVCDANAITLDNNLPQVDPDECTFCGACMSKCPVKIIRAAYPGKIYPVDAIADDDIMSGHSTEDELYEKYSPEDF